MTVVFANDSLDPRKLDKEVRLLFNEKAREKFIYQSIVAVNNLMDQEEANSYIPYSPTLKELLMPLEDFLEMSIKNNIQLLLSLETMIKEFHVLKDKEYTNIMEIAIPLRDLVTPYEKKFKPSIFIIMDSIRWMDNRMNQVPQSPVYNALQGIKRDLEDAKVLFDDIFNLIRLYVERVHELPSSQDVAQTFTHLRTIMDRLEEKTRSRSFYHLVNQAIDKIDHFKY